MGTVTVTLPETGVQAEWISGHAKHPGSVAAIAWMTEPKGPGVQPEEVLHMVASRLEQLNAELPDPHTQQALVYVHCAIGELEARTADRKARKAEGTREA